MRYDYFLRTLTLIALLMIFVGIVMLIVNVRIADKSCSMRFPHHKVPYGVQGVWYLDDGEEFMCVWIDNEVNDTITHETCHSLVYNDYDHFCYAG